MYVYTDLETNDEVLTDAYDLIDKGVVWEVKSWKCDPDNADGVDIGANASQEEAPEEMDEQREQVINLVFKFDLQEQPVKGSELADIVKKYISKIGKKLKETDPDNAKEKLAQLTEFFKQVKANLKKDPEFYSYYVNKSFEGMPILAYYEGEDVSPRFIYFKDGLKSEKC